MATSNRPFINVDLFTDAYRVTGRVAASSGGLVTELNNSNTDFLDLEDAYVSRVHEPGKIIANYSLASFRKQNINFIVLSDRREGLSLGNLHSKSVYTRGRPIQVFLTVPSFEVHGEVMFEVKASPSNIMLAIPGQYQPIFAATASASLYPDIAYNGDLILVHKTAIGVFCLSLNKN